MSSSTSSFDAALPAKPWARTWTLAVLVALGLIGAMEASLRRAGHEPSVADDMNLWCLEREAASQADVDPIALVGSSRMLMGIDTRALRREFPGHPIRELAIVGKDGLATLRDLAGDERFRGLVLFDFQPSSIMPAVWDDQAGHVRYYHAQWNACQRLERTLQTCVQERLVIVSPNLNPRLLAWAARHRTWFSPSCIQVLSDRSIRVDFHRPGVTDLERSRVIVPVERQGSGEIVSDPSGWFDGLAQLETLAARIEGRGGKVVLIGFPLGEDARKTLDRYFPASMDWKELARRSRVPVISFEDLPVASRLACFDGAHLDVPNAALFTKALADDLRKRKIVRQSSIVSGGADVAVRP